jgi:Flp pilus assembly protein TadG
MIRRPSYRSSNKRQRGLAIVEFTIVLPLMLLLLLATAELGRAFYEYNTLTKTVRDGARYLADVALDGTTGIVDLTDAKIAETVNLVVYGNIAGTGDPLLNGLSVADISVVEANPTHIQVSASYQYSPIFPGGIPTFGLGSGNISTGYMFQAQVTMRVL